MPSSPSPKQLKKTTSVILRAEVIKALKAEAANQGRSVSNLVDRMIAEKLRVPVK